MKLNQICNVFSGYAFKSFNNDKSGIPIIKIGNILIDGSIDLDKCQYSTETPNEKYLSQKGDIYVALSGATTGKIGLMNKEGYYVNQRVGIVRMNDDSISVSYLLYFLQSKTKKILNDAVGAAQPNISPKDISNYNFPVFSFDVMSSISNELFKIDNAIKNKQKQLYLLDELIKSRFVRQEAMVWN